MAQQRMLLPFRSNTRQRLQPVSSVVYSAGQQATPVELPRVGMINRLFVQVRGTMTLSSAGALTDLGPFNLINRIKFNINIGSTTIVDLTGYGAFLVSAIQERSFRPDRAGTGDTVPHPDNYAAPVASGANTWVLSYIIPIAANQGANFDLGLLNLQAPEMRATVEITWGNPTDAATNATGFVGSAFISYEYYEIPDPTIVKQPPLVLVRTLQETQSITQTGDTIYTLPRMGTLLQLGHVVRANGARSDGLDEFRIAFNKTDTILRYQRQILRLCNRLEYGSEYPVGVYMHDFWHSMGDVSTGDTRDAIDTEQLSTVESIVTVSSGTTLGSNNNFLDSIRKIVQVIQL